MYTFAEHFLHTYEYILIRMGIDLSHIIGWATVSSLTFINWSHSSLEAQVPWVHRCHIVLFISMDWSDSFSAVPVLW